MPITPFHFGLGATLHGAAPKTVSFLAFCAANVLIDVESLYNLAQQRYPVHAFFHTYVGASIVVALIPLLFIALRRWTSRIWLPDLFSWRDLTVRQVAIGGALGAYSHVVLDSVMHADIRPLAPFSEANALHGLLSLAELHLLCIASAALGLAMVGLRRLHTTETRSH